jgi:phosphate transport system ATP-binding protein
VTPPDQDHPKIMTVELSVSFGETQALRGVSLRIPGNRVTVLIGPSGCGKTTLLRSLNRLNELTAGAHRTGRILIDGVEIHGPEVDPTALRRRVGLIFQKSNPFPQSIYENVAYGPRLNGVRSRAQLDEVIESSLRVVGLWDEVRSHLRSSALSLSGGQQQRLCIARALAVGPEVLLMDEPATALDPAATGRIEDLIYELKSTVTIVMVTHNLQQAARVSDVTAFLHRGRLVEADLTRKMFTSPRVPETEAYITGRFG